MTACVEGDRINVTNLLRASLSFSSRLASLFRPNGGMNDQGRVPHPHGLDLR